MQTWLVEWDRDHWSPLSASLATREEVLIHMLCPDFFPLPLSLSVFFFFLFPWLEGSVRVIANETRVLTMLG